MGPQKGTKGRTKTKQSGVKDGKTFRARVRTRSERRAVIMATQVDDVPESSRGKRRCDPSVPIEGESGVKCAKTICIDLEESEHHQLADETEDNSIMQEHAVSNVSSYMSLSEQKEFLSSRTISACRRIGESFFIGRRISWVDKIKKPAMWSFFNLSDNVHPALVQDFYSNMNVPEEGVEEIFVDTTVKSKKIHLTVETLGNILGIPAVGSNVLNLSTKEQQKALQRAVQIVNGKRSGKQSIPKTSELSPDNRLLHHIICFQVLPRSGDFSRVQRNDIILLVDILEEKDINLPAIILTDMIRSVRGPRPRAFSPFGNVVTKICSYFGVDMSKLGEGIQAQIYTETTLKMMKIRTDPDTKKLVRVQEHTHVSGPNPMEEVLDLQRAMAVDMKKLLRIHEEKEKGLQEREKYLEEREKKLQAREEKYINGIEDNLEKLMEIGNDLVAAAEAAGIIAEEGEDGDEEDNDEVNVASAKRRVNANVEVEAAAEGGANAGHGSVGNDDDDVEADAAGGQEDDDEGTEDVEADAVGGQEDDDEGTDDVETDAAGSQEDDDEGTDDDEYTSSDADAGKADGASTDDGTDA